MTDYVMWISAECLEAGNWVVVASALPVEPGKLGAVARSGTCFSKREAQQMARRLAYELAAELRSQGHAVEDPPRSRDSNGPHRIKHRLRKKKAIVYAYLIYDEIAKRYVEATERATAKRILKDNGLVLPETAVMVDARSVDELGYLLESSSPGEGPQVFDRADS